MDWMAIIQLIIAVLTSVLSILGKNPIFGGSNGGNTAAVRVAAVEPVYSTDCQDPSWVFEPKIVNARFHGRVVVDCIVSLNQDGNLEAARAAYSRRVQQLGAENTSYDSDGEGWTSEQSDLAISAQTDDQKDIPVQGVSAVVAQSDAWVRSQYRATEPPTGSGASYLEQFLDRVEISATDSTDAFHVRLTYEPWVKKPWYVSDGAFVDEMTKQLEEKMVERTPEMLKDVVAKLAQ